MKKIILFVTFMVTCISSYADGVIFIDSLTGSKIIFPAGSTLRPSENSGFYKCSVSLSKSDISVYSMKNVDGKQYTWNTINKFDENDKYGTFINTEKIEGLDIEGWQRFYLREVKDGENYFNCVTALRGKNYAVYLLESAYKKEDMLSLSIVKCSTFVGSTKTIRGIQKYQFYWFAIALASIIIPFLLYPIRKKMEGKLKWTLILFFTIVGSIATGLWLTNGWICILALLIYLLVWYVVLSAENWTDIWNHIFKNILDNI